MPSRVRTLALLVLLAYGAGSPLPPLAQEPEVPEEAAQEESAGPGLEQPVDPPQEEPAGPAPEEAAPPVREEAAAADDQWEMPTVPGGLLEDDVFIPTEEIQADEEVTFPVNI